MTKLPSVTEPFSRREFVSGALTCSAHLALMSAAVTPAARRLFAAVPIGETVTREPWGRLESLGEGLWALVSTPLSQEHGREAMRTFSNGGIIAGRDGVLIVEGFATPEGAKWMAESARSLTGHWPTHVVLTHYHGDHSRGLAGYREIDVPIPVYATDETRRLLKGREPLPDTVIADEGSSAEVDLGGRVVRIIPRAGHTSSDVTIEVEEPNILWCGDLLWNGMFPNYVDAIPSRLSRHVGEMLSDRDTLYVPGHGSLAKRAEFERYVAVLDDVEENARAALDQGVPVEQAAKQYRLPESLGEWTMFSSSYYAVAFRAWERERTANRVDS